MNDYPKYLYGAAVQGIQNFILQTNKLKEIVGASELVAQICTSAFEEFEEKGKGDSIVRAAGNIKYIFTSKEKCEKAVLEFPRKVMMMAPGVIISQAVVLLENENDYPGKANELEKKLRTQRNKPVRPVNLGLTAMKRAPSTGFPGIKYDKNEDGKIELIDEASALKRRASGETLILAKKAFRDNIRHNEMAFNINEITDKNNWIAVIHADGNGLGKIFQTLGKSPVDMQEFSAKLDEITQISARIAFQIVERHFNEIEKIPLRPVVLSGDDLTMICRADLAIEYTQLFLEEFEKISKKELNTIKLINEDAKNIIDKGLTACAGIAFIKATYPFHYAVSLAESLCKRTKEIAKTLVKEEDFNLPPSCLMFHKVQDSFITDIKEIIVRTLTPQENISLEFGPYYCGERAKELSVKYPVCEHTINRLMENVNLIRSEKEESIKSNLRQWLTLLFDDEGKANQRMIRITRMANKETVNKLQLENYINLKRGQSIKIPFYDILSIASLYIETENKKIEEVK